VSRCGVVTGVAAALLLAGADGGGCRGEREVPVRAVGAGARCGGGGDFPLVRVLRTSEEVRALLGPGKDPGIDWVTEAAVMITDGQKPTGGYAVALASGRGPVKDGALGIRIAVTAPADGMMAAQVVTSPCLVVAFKTEGLKGVGAMVGDRVVAKSAL